jgi:NAD(P)-dependent dehydrogenase (short-subunit alcohol dehydrogenase family)
MELDGRVALVTGASRGIGAATAVALARAGCDVAIAARSTAAQPQRTPGTLDDTAANVRAEGRRVAVIPTNLADPDEVVAMVRTAERELGRVDVLVNNAAVNFVADLDMPMHRYEITFAVNVRAPFLAIREALPAMLDRGEGAIVNVSSGAALDPVPDLMVYGVSKAALERLSMQVACRAAPHQVAVNVFRIDVPCVSEGFLVGAPEMDTSTWQPAAVPAEGIAWLCRQPPSFTGHRVSLWSLLHEGTLASRSAREWTDVPRTEILDGVVPLAPSVWREPYPD